MKSVAAAANHTFPTTFKLVDVYACGPPTARIHVCIRYSLPFALCVLCMHSSLLVGLDPKESGDLKLEEDFFKANPTLGHLINWPLLTDLIGPCLVSESKRIKEATDGHWDLDDLPAKVRTRRWAICTQRSWSPAACRCPCCDPFCTPQAQTTSRRCSMYIARYEFPVSMPTLARASNRRGCCIPQAGVDRCVQSQHAATAVAAIAAVELSVGRLICTCCLAVAAPVSCAAAT